MFQTYNLMPVLTALQNVELPLLLTKLSGSRAQEARRRPRSGSSAWRTASITSRASCPAVRSSASPIARAIVTDPKIIVADEPTGDLDRKSADEILDLLEQLNHEFNKTILMVTHDPAAAERAPIVRRLDKGALQ